MLVMCLTENTSAKHHLNPLVLTMSPFLCGLLWEKFIASDSDKWQMLVANRMAQEVYMGSQEEFWEYTLLVGGDSHWLTLKGMKIRISNAFVWVSYKQYGQKRQRSPSTQHRWGHFHCCLLVVVEGPAEGSMLIYPIVKEGLQSN